MNPDTLDKPHMPDADSVGESATNANPTAAAHGIGSFSPLQTPMPVPPVASTKVPSSGDPNRPGTLTAAAADMPLGPADQEFERKWVNTAKTIVERTKRDPYLQSQELSKAGVEYRKRRFGREHNAGKE